MVPVGTMSGLDAVVRATSTPALFGRHGKSSMPAEPAGALRCIENRLLAASFQGTILGNQWIKYQTAIDATVYGDVG